jgi:hypothetical protein
VEEFAAGPVGALVCVRSEVVALGLDQVCREAAAVERIIMGNRSHHNRNRDTPVNGKTDALPPSTLQFSEAVGHQGRL